MNKFLNRPLQFKIISVCVFANIIIFIVNLFLILGINSMSQDMEMVYQDNRSLNELSEALNNVQDSMTVYLSSKTSESLEEYYRDAQTFSAQRGEQPRHKRAGRHEPDVEGRLMDR